MSFLPSLPERNNLYINSYNGLSNLSNPGETEIIIPSGILRINDDEHYYINIIQFNTFNSFYNVIDGYNNEFEMIKNGEITIGKIPDGNININIIQGYLTSLFTYLVTIDYDKIKNKFTFKNITQNNISLKLINCHSLLGFQRNKSIIELPTNINITSDIPINVMSITNLFVHLTGSDLNINDNNFDNHKSTVIKTNSIIFSLIVDKPYNHILSYNNNDGGNSFYFRCDKQQDITGFKLIIKDQYDQVIPYLPDWSMIIQLTKRKNENFILKYLETINNNINKLLLIIASLFIS